MKTLYETLWFMLKAVLIYMEILQQAINSNHSHKVPKQVSCECLCWFTFVTSFDASSLSKCAALAPAQRNVELYQHFNYLEGSSTQFPQVYS